MELYLVSYQNLCPGTQQPVLPETWITYNWAITEPYILMKRQMTYLLFFSDIFQIALVLESLQLIVPLNIFTVACQLDFRVTRSGPSSKTLFCETSSNVFLHYEFLQKKISP